MTSRRGFILGLTSLLAAPAIVRAELLMPVRSIIMPEPTWHELDIDPTLGQGGGNFGGVTIIRYAGPSRFTGGTIKKNGGYTVHTFEFSGGLRAL